MLRLRPQGYAQHERKVARSREPFTLSPSTGSGQAPRSEVEGRTRSISLHCKKDSYSSTLLRSPDDGG
jgi:hypothetical protein